MANLALTPGKLFFLSQLLFICSLTIAPSPYRWIVAPFLASIACYLAFYTTSGKPTTDYGWGCITFHLLFSASDFILLTDVQREFRQVGQREPPSNLPLIGRLKWALNLFISPRGVGWTFEPTSVMRPYPTTTSRIAFISSQLLWAIFYFTCYDLASIANRRNPSYAAGGPSIAAFGWTIRSFSILGFAVVSFSTLSWNYCLLSAACVATGQWRPQDFPHVMGFLGDAYTLRRFWGRTWHQLLRRTLSAHGKFLAHRVLSLKHGTNPSAYVQLYTAFFISALIHYMGDYMMLRNWSGGAMWFFLLQAVAIMFEDAVIALASRLGVGPGSRASGWGSVGMWNIIGYVWVWQWFAWSLPIWLDPLFSGGLMEGGLNISLIEGVWSGTWRPTYRTGV